MIESLTPAQEIEKREWRNKYFAFGWSTERSNRTLAEANIAALYKRQKLTVPQFVWVDSPYAAVQIIKESTGEAVTLSGHDGGIDGYWLAFYTFCAHIGGRISIEDKEHLLKFDIICRSTGPYYPYRNICLMTERPVRATYDDRELLHGEDAPALEYLDGHKLYAIHGVTVPEQVVMRPWEMTLAQIEGESDTDIQTIMQDRWCHEKIDATGRRCGAGGGRWLEETGAQVCHTDFYVAYTDEETGESVRLQRALIKDKNGRQYLMCSDSSTDRIYYIRVAPDAKTCQEGHMSINGGIPDADIVVSA